MKKTSLRTTKNDQEFGQILGINVIGTTMPELLARVEDFISHSQKFSIVTPNPELILMAQKNQLLKNALNSADLSVPDGAGLKLAIPELNIIKGRKLFMELIELANKKSWKVVLLGGLDEEAERAGVNLSEKFRNVRFECFRGPILDKNGEPVTKMDRKLESDVVDRTNSFAPHLLFVAFGNPKQEIWIHKNLSKLNIGSAMAVGGTLCYIAGLVALPPKWMESLGLEWLWRLIHEPKRIKRIWNAVVVFPIKVFQSKLSQ